jgi:mannose-6-phosphate isomerase
MPLDLCPLLLEPRLVPKPWGGRRLSAWGKRLPARAAIGESWELFDDAAGSAKVSAGPAKGKALRALMRAWGAKLLGPGARKGSAFPLLLKLLDARQDLSVQVHPDDRLARARHGARQGTGKDEMWVVLEAARGAAVYAGFRPGTERRHYAEALATGKLLKALRRWPVKAGDVLRLPAGRIHAVGRGCVLAEVQQNSDHTYRIWDWGRDRPLHLDAAAQALRFGRRDAQPVRVRPAAEAAPWGRRERLTRFPSFAVERWTLRGPRRLAAGARPWILLPVAGTLRLVWGREQGMMVPPAHTVLLPAALAVRLEPQARCTLIAARPA